MGLWDLNAPPEAAGPERTTGGRGLLSRLLTFSPPDPDRPVAATRGEQRSCWVPTDGPTARVRVGAEPLDRRQSLLHI